MNISTNNTTFQARLDISKVKTNRARWHQVAEIVPKITKSNPNGVIRVVETTDGMHVTAIENARKNPNSMLDALFFNKTMDETFTMFDNNTIAKTLAKFFRIGQTAKKELVSAEKLANSMAEKNDNANYKNYNDTFAYFYDEARSIIEDDVTRKAERDEIMKQWEIILD